MKENKLIQGARIRNTMLFKLVIHKRNGRSKKKYFYASTNTLAITVSKKLTKNTNLPYDLYNCSQI